MIGGFGAAMGYGILRGQKVHTSGLKGIEIHNNRERPSRSNPDIERKRTVENYSLLDEGGESLNKRVNARCQELSGGKKIRSDAVKMYDFIATASPEDMAKMSPAQQRRFFEDTRDFLIKKFGKENLMYAKVHMDEATPHMHVGIVPEYQGRLCAKKLFTPSSMRKLQDEYFREVSSKYGLDRGEVGSSKRHQKTRDFKRRTDYNGKEQENLKALEAAAKERPITEGFLNKKIIGYQVSPEWLDESLRLARVGGQAADEKDAKERAELDLKKSLEREKAANAEAARLRIDNDILRDEIQKKEVELVSTKRDAGVYLNAPDSFKKELKEKELNYANIRNAVHKMIGLCAAAYGDRALQNPIVQACLQSLGANDPKKQKQLLNELSSIINGKHHGRTAEPWDSKADAKSIIKMPLDAAQKAVGALIKKLAETGKEMARSALQYMKEPENQDWANEWEYMSEAAKSEKQLRRAMSDDY